jgi:predicted ATPase
MFTKVEASGYRCLKDVSQELRPFQILVGPNGSGKSAFLDVIAFLGEVVSNQLYQTIRPRTENFHDLVWGRDGNTFRLAIEASIGSSPADTIRYEVTVRIDTTTDDIMLEREEVSIRQPGGMPRTVLKRDKQQVSFFDEVGDGRYSFEFNLNYSALANLPPDQSKFPASVWLKDTLREGVQTVILDNQLLRRPSPPGQGRPNKYDGRNMARLVAFLSDLSREDFNSWLEHIQTALPDIASIRTVLRSDDNHRYVLVKYKNGIEVPSWMLSDGTLRLLALTLLAYLPRTNGTYLIEEPEVGVHPTALETIMQSLSSVYDGQVLVTSHSPIVLGLSKPDEILCFQMTDAGTKIVRGDEHPLLQEWRSSVNLSDLFAAGVLG